ncbi:nuclear transport factor 2 family protein [Streptomyces sp. NPDC002896]|uniref:nuclear transport factor 2 family protein n=1 Tax=Streptomyces sp. NPDC002896 TaxID=3154438 RepID=UPI0033201A4C
MSQDEVIRCTADELAVRNIIAKVSLYTDGGDVDSYVELFAKDAVWEMPGNQRTGHDEIRAGNVSGYAAGLLGPGTGSRHIVGTTAVDIQGDTATAESQWVFVSGGPGSPAISAAGHYLDTFRRTSDGWKITRRQLTLG